MGVEDLAETHIRAFILRDLGSNELVEAADANPGSTVVVVEVEVAHVGEEVPVVEHADTSQSLWPDPGGSVRPL